MTKITYTFGEPIVFERRKKGKKKKKKSISVDFRQSEKHLTKAMQRTIRASDKGMTRYRKASKKSAKKRNDDLILDFVPNVIAGTAVTMRELTLVPLDLMKAAYTPQTRRIMRRSLRATMQMSDDYLP